MIDVRFNLHGEKQLASALRRLADASGKGLGKEIEHSAVRICRSMAEFTAPRGFAKSDRRPSEKRIAGDIAAVYATPADVYGQIVTAAEEDMADGFWEAMKSGKRAKAQKILGRSTSRWRAIPVRSPKVNPSHHQTARKGRGRVDRRRRPSQVVSEDNRRRYTAKIQKRIGRAKAGWYRAALSIRSRTNIPRWAGSSHQGVQGITVKTGSAHNPTLHISNPLPYIRKLLTVRPEWVLEHEGRILLKQARAILKKNANRHGRGQWRYKG